MQTSIAMPIGLWLGHIGKGQFVAINISNVGRAIPSLALLAFFIAYLGVGVLNLTVVLLLLAIPPILTNTYIGTTQTDRDAVDAARGMGFTEGQIVRKVELPLALPTIFGGIRIAAVNVFATATIAPLASVGTRQVDPSTVDAARGQGMSEWQIMRKVELPLGVATMFGGIRTSTVNVVATATIAPLASVDTLGLPIINGNVYGFSGTLGASIVVAALTLAIDGVFAITQRAVTPKGIKLRAGASPGRGKFFAIGTRRGEQVT